MLKISCSSIKEAAECHCGEGEVDACLPVSRKQPKYLFYNRLALMNELAKARLRGVEARAILDYQKSSYKLSADEANFEAFNFFKNNGIEVYFDSVG